ncbi:MAG: class I SAM-dependent methyltransferase [bacterium]
MSKQEILKNHQKYLSRIKLYRDYGYYIERERELILDLASPLNGDILEIGTGYGYTTIALARRGYHLTTLDISEESQYIAKMNVAYYGLLDRVTFRIGDTNALDFVDGTFDVVICVNTLHHLRTPIICLSEMRRVLRPDGMLILSDFTEEGFSLVEKIHASEGEVHNRTKYTFGDYAIYLRLKNFKVEMHQNRFQIVMTASKAISAVSDNIIPDKTIYKQVMESEVTLSEEKRRQYLQ